MHLREGKDKLSGQHEMLRSLELELGMMHLVFRIWRDARATKGLWRRRRLGNKRNGLTEAEVQEFAVTNRRCNGDVMV